MCGITFSPVRFNFRFQHATSAVDYRVNKEFRMAATVYIADVNEDNVENIMNE
jgi:hypothetical protein